MTFQYKNHCTFDDSLSIQDKNFRLIQLNDGEIQTLIDWLVVLAPEHYYDLSSELTRLGTKYAEEIANKLANKQLLAHLPTVKKIKSGDIGEILARHYGNPPINNRS
ncbi:hypothetical protein B9T12_08970 [Wohlfahrtiimonas chitiniclastica]|uniref:hypothetical protein n=1 Tax=Wohlfahrtiimonas chitiniclastica TaxID=400946 RepID=UPI000B99BC80|nr:hypothetical protein [Wohlfahrtiimonas chitiniclastica]OYQ77094.1 hypothetical protein B9T12_08970 [Wohlfahrtiimonas chitiniclastica]